MKDEKILQLKINLDGTNPEIWRRFIVEDSITFHKLHKIIQKVMGWENYHLYNFQLGDLCIEGEEGGMICVDAMWRGFRPTGTKSQLAKQTRINELIKKEKQKFKYIYDLGDNWRHSIVVEKIMEKDDQRYPVCIAGERACPPEDCGSVFGYEELIKIRKDKNHPQYQERIVEWLGEDYDPELFVIDWVNAKLHSKRPASIWVPTNRAKFEAYEEKNIKKQRKLGRNEPCHCGSDKKYKKCCLNEDVKKYGKSIRVDY